MNSLKKIKIQLNGKKYQINMGCNLKDLLKAIKKANKLMHKEGRLLVRKSGTEPKIRIMGESHNKKLILKCIKLIKKSII